jgi:hypothetical protein
MAAELEWEVIRARILAEPAGRAALQTLLAEPRGRADLLRMIAEAEEAEVRTAAEYASEMAAAEVAAASAAQ